MARAVGHSEETSRLRRQLQSEREELARSVDSIRAATHLGAQLRPKLPVLALAAFGLGFVASGGIGAVMRLLARRGREGRTAARVGRFAVVDRAR